MSKVTTVVLFVLLVLGLTAYLLWSAPPPAVDAIPARFLDFEPSAVASVDTKSPAGELHLERDPDDPDRWRVRAGGNLVRADSARVEDFLQGLSRMAPKSRWAKEEVTAAERTKWGLDSPGTTVRLELASGGILSAGFGERTALGSDAYAERDGDGAVWVVPLDGIRPVEGGKPESLREREPLGFSTYDLKELAVERADGLRFAAAKETGGTWTVTEPFRGAADPSGIESLAAKILGLRVMEFVADGTVDRDRYGLLEPRATLTVRRQGVEEPIVVKIGGTLPEDRGSYFLEEGEPSVYACSPELPAALEKLDPAALRDRNALRLGWTRLDAIAYHRREPEWKLIRILERWDVEHPERVPAEATAVDAFLDRLRELEVDSFLDDADPASLGLGSEEGAPSRLILTGADEAGNRRLLLGEKREDGLVPARLLPEGKDREGRGVLFLLPGEFLDRLEEGWLSFRDRKVLEVELAEVRGMARRYGGEERTWRKDGPAWKGAEGGPEPDREALTRALSRLLTVRCLAYEGRTGEEELGKYGLGEDGPGPAITLLLGKEGAEERTETLVLGNPTPDGTGHYARSGSGDLVFVLEDRVAQGAEVLPFYEPLTAPWEKAPPKEE